MTAPAMPTRLMRAARRHLRDVAGLRGAQVFVGEAGDWVEGARLGELPPGAHERILSGFDPAAGGAIEPETDGVEGWRGSYSTTGAGLDLALVFRLGAVPPAELEARLSLIEARVGWLLVAALSDRREAAEARAGGADMTGPILLDAAGARSARRLADRWIARVERALAPDLAAVVWTASGRPRLRSLSGGGLAERPSDARDGLERLAEIADRRRAPLVLGGEDEAAEAPPDDLIDEAAVEVARLGAAHAMLMPVEEAGRTAAVVILFWREGPPPRLEMAEALSAALSEALAIQRRAHPSLLRRLGNWIAGGAIALFGRTAWKLKVALALIVATLVAAAFAPSSYRPSFPARIEATDRRVISAPFDGVLARAEVEAGDRVPDGGLLVAMEDADLRLELARAAARLGGVEAELQTARARRDTAEVRLLEAQAAQVATEVELLERRIDLARIEAEGPAIVIGGDARRRVGGRVRLGEPLLEVAAPDSIRLLGYIDESWVAEIEPGGQGAALLAAYPDRPVPARLERIGADPQDRDGVNSFPAWFAVTPEPDMRVLDGMRGVVRIEVDQVSVFAARTRGLRQWFSRTAWRLGMGGTPG